MKPRKGFNRKGKGFNAMGWFYRQGFNNHAESEPRPFTEPCKFRLKQEPAGDAAAATAASSPDDLEGK
jgi:hypothetical protein